MNAGDPVKVLVNEVWKSGTFLGQRQIECAGSVTDGDIVYNIGIGEPHHFNYEEEEFYPQFVKRFIPLSDEAEKAKHDAELPLAFAMVERALAELLPGETVEIKEGSISAYGGAVTLDPVVYETPRIGAVQESAGWQVTVWKYYHATRHEPEDYVDSPVGDATNYSSAVQRFIETIFKIKADGYWDHLADEAMAQAWEDGEM